MRWRRGETRDRRDVCDWMMMMMTDAISFSLCFAQYHQYQVVGRHVPTEAQPEPEVFRMKLWALDSVKARSKFWYVGRLG